MWSSTRWRANLVLALAAIACHATAQELPPSVLEGGRLTGQATMKFLGFSVYHARLWTRPGFDAQRLGEQALALELEYLREFRGSAIAERSLQEMRRAASIPAEQAQRWLGQMERIFPDVKSGDRLTGLHLPGEGASFWHNGRLAGRVADPQFARLFFGIWLSPTTSEPDLRLSLLGQSTGRR